MPTAPSSWIVGRNQALVAQKAERPRREGVEIPDNLPGFLAPAGPGAILRIVLAPEQPRQAPLLGVRERLAERVAQQLGCGRVVLLIDPPAQGRRERILVPDGGEHGVRNHRVGVADAAYVWIGAGS